MTRVIQDSDDEELEEDVEESHQDAPKAIAPVMSSTSGDPAQAGTGSTNSLKKAYQAAHHAQFQTQHDQSPLEISTHLNPESPTSISQDGAKRTESGPSDAISQRKLPPTSSAKYGSLTSSPFIHQLHGQPQAPNVQPAAYGEQCFQPHGGDPIHAGFAAGVTDNVWELEGTIRQNYADHEPMAMFPESSTIENTTATQERLMQEVLAPGFLGIDPEPELEPVLSPYKPQSTVPWSDFLKTQSVDNTQAQPSQEHGHERTSSQRNHDSQSAGIDGPDLVRPEMERLSQCSRPDTPDAQKSKMGTPKVRDEFTSHPKSGPLTSVDHSAIPRSNIPDSTEDVSAAKQCTSSNEKDYIEKDVSSQPPKKKRKSSQVVPSDDYLEEIGLPKEQYKPRPSRSRSLKTPLEEPIDYSVRPEKAASRPRRSKTTTEVDTLGAMSTPQKVQQICDMGFTPISTEQALEQNKGDVNRTIEWLVTRAANVDEDEDELAPPRTSKRKIHNKGAKTGSFTHNIQASKESLTPQKGSTTHMRSPPMESRSEPIPASDASIRDIHVENFASEPKTPGKVEVVIPWSKGSTSVPMPEEHPVGLIQTRTPESIVEAGSSRKAKRKQTELDPTEEDQEVEVETYTAPVAKKDKKKGRGRPKKAIAALPAVYKEAPTDDAEEGAKLDEAPTNDANDQASDQANDQAKDISPPSTKKPASPPPRASTPPRTTKTVPEGTTQTPETQVKPLNGNRSPSSKGKVSYRVGLSRRARIAPLLRIVKK